MKLTLLLHGIIYRASCLEGNGGGPTDLPWKEPCSGPVNLTELAGADTDTPTILFWNPKNIKKRMAMAIIITIRAIMAMFLAFRILSGDVTPLSILLNRS